MILPNSRVVNNWTRLLWLFLILLTPRLLLADQILVATASNFRDAMSALARQFESNTGHQVTVIPGSTGKHFAQVVHGAPFDAFFAADSERPQRLESEGLAVNGSRFTYAIGKLVLWSPQSGLVDPDGAILKHGNYRHLAIANPELAPYGRAAREVIEAMGLWDTLEQRLVRGENIAQAFQFVQSGNAELGFVALSQLKTGKHSMDGSQWAIPVDLYGAIEQQAVLLQESEVARDFFSFVQSAQAAKIIRAHGYETPGHDEP